MRLVAAKLLPRSLRRGSSIVDDRSPDSRRNLLERIVIELQGINLSELAKAAQAESDKAASNQIKGWIKGIHTEIVNSDLRAARLRADADSIDARTAAKRDQLARVLAGDWGAVDIEEIKAASGGGEKESKDK